MNNKCNFPSGFHQVEVKFGNSCDHGHFLFYKQHSSKKIEDSKPQERSIIVFNVPPYLNKKHMHEIFDQFGKIDSVIFENKISNLEESAPVVKEKTKEDLYFFSTLKCGFKTSFVVFKNKISINNLMKQSLSPITCSGGITGIKKWCKEYKKSYPDVEKLKINIDNFMARHDQIIHEQEALEKESAGLPDEDGWVKVTRKGNVPVAARTELNETLLKAKANRKKKSQELLNVYTFQIRESKREQIAELRKKFEDDKEKIKQMRESRRFKPF